jgi:hypothetical protein
VSDALAPDFCHLPSIRLALAGDLNDATFSASTSETAAAEQFITSEITFEQLDAQAPAGSDNDAAQRLNYARVIFFKTISTDRKQPLTTLQNRPVQTHTSIGMYWV